MQPIVPNGVEVDETGLQSFKSRLRRLSRTVAPNWQQILRLDRPTNTAATIGPPPRPSNFEAKDVASERLRWRNFIMRQPISPNDTDVQRMLALLKAYQTMEDRVVSRYLADAQG
jgi:hypothetical protein